MTVNPALLSALISAGGVVMSGFVSAFIAGARWGTVRQQIADVSNQQSSAATKDDLNNMNLRLARIEGMFELRLRDSQQ